MSQTKTKSNPQEGVVLCAGGCYRQLKPEQGKATPQGRMCFICVRETHS